MYINFQQNQVKTQVMQSSNSARIDKSYFTTEKIM